MAGLSIANNGNMYPPGLLAPIGTGRFPVANQGNGVHTRPQGSGYPTFDASSYHEFAGTAVAHQGPYHNPGTHQRIGRTGATYFRGGNDPSMATASHNTQAQQAQQAPQAARGPQYGFHEHVIVHGSVGYSHQAFGQAMTPVHPQGYIAPPAEFYQGVSSVGPAAAVPANPVFNEQDFNAAFGAFDEQDFSREIDAWITEHGATQGQQQDQDQRPILPPTAQEMAVIDANLEAMAQELEARRAAGDPAVLPQRGPEADARRARQEQEDLVRAASDILTSVSDNTSDKFKNSSFLDLMRRIQKEEIVVAGQDLVDAQTGETIVSKAQVNGQQRPGIANGTSGAGQSAKPVA